MITQWDIKRFLVRIVKREDGHWHLDGVIKRKCFRLHNREQIQAYRISYIIHKGPIPDGMNVLHIPECNRGWCINPDHLYLGTQAENMFDRWNNLSRIPRRTINMKI